MRQTTFARRMAFATSPGSLRPTATSTARGKKPFNHLLAIQNFIIFVSESLLGVKKFKIQIWKRNQFSLWRCRSWWDVIHFLSPAFNCPESLLIWRYRIFSRLPRQGCIDVKSFFPPEYPRWCLTGEHKKCCNDADKCNNGTISDNPNRLGTSNVTNHLSLTLTSWGKVLNLITTSLCQLIKFYFLISPRKNPLLALLSSTNKYHLLNNRRKFAKKHFISKKFSNLFTHNLAETRKVLLAFY